MGQRLVIHVMNGDVELANAYYHWSGYTSSALDLLEKMYKGYNSQLEESCTINGVLDNRLLAIRLLEATGAGIYIEDEAYVKEIFPNLNFNSAVDRNEGLISISESSMNDSSCWSEGDLYIDFVNKKVNFNVLLEADYDCILYDAIGDRDYDSLSKNEVNKLVEEYKLNLPELKLDGYWIDNIPFDKIKDFCEKMMKIDYCFKMGNDFYSKIE